MHGAAGNPPSVVWVEVLGPTTRQGTCWTHPLFFYFVGVLAYDTK